jgi:L-alanine-DL-glutamate epimerase-like enolase superfamily enzyme
LGPDVALLVDAAQLIASPKASIRLARRIEEFDIGWYEEPVMGSNPQSEAKVTAAINIPVATGEYTYNHQGIFELLQLKAADILMPDLRKDGRTDGVPESRSPLRGIRYPGVVPRLSANEPRAHGVRTQRELS